MDNLITDERLFYTIHYLRCNKEFEEVRYFAVGCPSYSCRYWWRYFVISHIVLYVLEMDKAATLSLAFALALQLVRSVSYKYLIHFLDPQPLRHQPIRCFLTSCYIYIYISRNCEPLNRQCSKNECALAEKAEVMSNTTWRRSHGRKRVPRPFTVALNRISSEPFISTRVWKYLI